MKLDPRVSEALNLVNPKFEVLRRGRGRRGTPWKGVGPIARCSSKRAGAGEG